jgi:molybdopterin biosynthesis enzyme MoaB
MKKEKIKHQHKDKSLEITAAVVEIKPKIRFEDKIDEQIKEIKEKKTVTNVYNADYKLIDDTIEEIKKASRKVCTNDYAANNVYIILQFALKKVVLAEA